MQVKLDVLETADGKYQGEMVVDGTRTITGRFKDPKSAMRAIFKEAEGVIFLNSPPTEPNDTAAEDHSRRYGVPASEITHD